MKFTVPTDQYWEACAKRLQENIANLSQPPSFIETLVCISKFLECIDMECGENVKRLTFAERHYIAVCMAAKIIFNSPIMENLDIPYFLSYSYTIRSSSRV